MNYLRIGLGDIPAVMTKADGVGVASVAELAWHQAIVESSLALFNAMRASFDDGATGDLEIGAIGLRASGLVQGTLGIFPQEHRATTLIHGQQQIERAIVDGMHAAFLITKGYGMQPAPAEVGV